MSWDVEKAFWHDWEPGQHIIWETLAAETKTHTAEELQADWERWVKRNYDVCHKLLLALANNSTITGPDWAMTFVKVENMAVMIRRSVRQTQRILRELERGHELVKTPCDAASCQFYHGDSYHWFLPRPAESKPWGDLDVYARKRQRRLTREDKQPRAPRQRRTGKKVQLPG